MSVPNFKRRALFVEKLLGGPKISKLGQVTLSYVAFEPETLHLCRLIMKSDYYVSSNDHVSGFSPPFSEIRDPDLYGKRPAVSEPILPISRAAINLITLNLPIRSRE